MTYKTEFQQLQLYNFLEESNAYENDNRAKSHIPFIIASNHQNIFINLQEQHTSCEL